MQFNISQLDTWWLRNDRIQSSKQDKSFIRDDNAQWMMSALKE